MKTGSANRRHWRPGWSDGIKETCVLDATVHTSEHGEGKELLGPGRRKSQVQPAGRPGNTKIGRTPRRARKTKEAKKDQTGTHTRARETDAKSRRNLAQTREEREEPDAGMEICGTTMKGKREAHEWYEATAVATLAQLVERWKGAPPRRQQTRTVPQREGEVNKTRYQWERGLEPVSMCGMLHVARKRVRLQRSSLPAPSSHFSPRLLPLPQGRQAGGWKDT